MVKNIRERAIGATGSVSGAASILGSWQVCHNVCLGIVALLSLIGITVVGMPLAFLTRLTVPLWTAALVLFGITLFFYITKKCISSRLIMFNAGLLIAGVPFQQVQQFLPFFWAAGGMIALTGIFLFIRDKIRNKHRIKDKQAEKKQRGCHGIKLRKRLP